jgi:hypothetical protein
MSNRLRAARRIVFASGLAAAALAATTRVGRPYPLVASTPFSDSTCMSLSPSGVPTVRWYMASPDVPTPVPSPRWCAAVGPVYAAGPENSAARPVDELAVVTWNVHVGGGDVPRLVADLRSGALTGDPVTDFVLLIQEAYRAGDAVPVGPGGGALTSRIDEIPPSGKRVDVVELARELRLHVFYAPSMPNGVDLASGVREDRGNAILSTMPLAERTAMELPFERQRRVAISSVISGTATDGTPWTLRVASGHLENRTESFNDTFGPARARQASALVDFLGGEAVLLGADLNTWGADFMEDAPDILYAHFPQSPRITGATYTLGGVLPRKIDHLLFRLPDGASASAKRVDSRYGSDHNPLVGTVTFAKNGG